MRKSPTSRALVVMLSGATLIGCAEQTSPPREPTRPDPSAVTKPTGRDGHGAMMTRHWLDHVQRCGPRCTYQQRGKSTVALDLWTDGRVEVHAQGQVLERFRGATGKRRQVTDWERTWTGRWEEVGADRLELKLAQRSLICERQRDDGATDRPCQPVDELVLSCQRLRVRLAHKTPTAAWTWTCRGKQPAPMAFPTLPWVFSDDGEVATIDKGVDESWHREYVRPKKGEAKRSAAR